MSSLLEQLAGQLSGGQLDQIASQLGADRGATEKAVSGALPMLLGGLARNAGSSSGLASLAGALDRDHDGSILDDLGGFLGNSGVQQRHGGGILGHVLGNRQSNVTNAISRNSGLDGATVQKLLMMLAPLVMAQLGKAKRSNGLDAGGLGSLLSQEQTRMTQGRPELGMLGSLLDQDGDGDVFDDVAKAGTGLLGSLFGRR